MKQRITANRKPLPGEYPHVVAKLNPRWVVGRIAVWLILANVLANFAAVVILGDRYDDHWMLYPYIVLLIVAFLACTEPRKYRFVDAPPAPPAPAEPKLAPAMSALVGQPVYFKEGGFTGARNGGVVGIVDKGYPIPDSIARALGAQATAQIKRDTKEGRL